MDQAILYSVWLFRVLLCWAFEIVAWICFKGAQPTWHYSVSDQPTWTPSEGDLPVWIFRGLVFPLLFPTSLCWSHSWLISGASRNVGWRSQEKHNQSKLKAGKHIDKRFSREGIMIISEFLKHIQILLIHNIFDLIYQRKWISLCSSQPMNVLKRISFL